MIQDLKDLQLADKYKSLVQVEANVLYDGEGNPISPSFANTRTYTATFSKQNLTIDTFLKNGEAFSNVSPFVVPFTGKLLAISASSDGSFTWSAKVYKNGTFITGAVLAITSASSGLIDLTSLNITLTAGDKLSVYCESASVYSPSVSLFGTF